jgi:hypothetical protein
VQLADREQLAWLAAQDLQVQLVVQAQLAK